MQRFRQERAFSSAGSEHLPYKQRVGGSNPSTPTKRLTSVSRFFYAFMAKFRGFFKILVPKILDDSFENELKFFRKKLPKLFEFTKKAVPLHHFQQERAFSSAGSEHLPYKQRVGGSNPSTPTKRSTLVGRFFYLQQYENE